MKNPCEADFYLIYYSFCALFFNLFEVYAFFKKSSTKSYPHFAHILKKRRYSGAKCNKINLKHFGKVREKLKNNGHKNNSNYSPGMFKCKHDNILDGYEADSNIRRNFNRLRIFVDFFCVIVHSLHGKSPMVVMIMIDFNPRQRDN